MSMMFPEYNTPLPEEVREKIVGSINKLGGLNADGTLKKKVNIEEDAFSHYDMTYRSPIPTWKDAATIPLGLAIIGVSYARYLFSNRFSKIR